ncbi:WXG100 family type VII secretion target [Kitasatospora sp. NPDC086801]|uniref:WXG100 family type VII secretion target n=1 Tax=Kitasatospora sp. NPDC086801 TaxID=3364066 RepID=UPI003826FBBD
MVSFKELHEADFSGITDAAEAWAGVAKALTALDGRVAKDLTSTAQRAGWKGAAADDATKVLQAVDGDFKQASTVATALAAIMKTAAEDFAAARRDLDTAIHDAQSDNMTVAADGRVNWTLPKETRNDPDGEQLAQTLAAKAEAIAARLTKAVEKADSADQRATAALQGDIGTTCCTIGSGRSRETSRTFPPTSLPPVAHSAMPWRRPRPVGTRTATNRSSARTTRSCRRSWTRR